MFNGDLIGLFGQGGQSISPPLDQMTTDYNKIRPCDWMLSSPAQHLGLKVASPTGQNGNSPLLSKAQIGPVTLLCVGLVRYLDNYKPYIPSHIDSKALSPADHLAYAFLALGPKLFSKINSHIALYIWHKDENKLYLMRGKIGCIPIFYASNNEYLALSNRPDVFQCINIKPEIDLKDVARLTLQKAKRITDRAHFFKSIQAVAPGHYLDVKGKTIKSIRYWAPQINSEISRLSVKDATEGFRDAFASTMKSYTNTGLKFGSFMSGGLDSSAIISMYLSQALQN